RRGAMGRVVIIRNPPGAAAPADLNRPRPASRGIPFDESAAGGESPNPHHVRAAARVGRKESSHELGPDQGKLAASFGPGQAEVGKTHRGRLAGHRWKARGTGGANSEALWHQEGAD